MVAGLSALSKEAFAVKGQAIQVKWSSGTEAPVMDVPKNACDCHHHIYDPEHFPYDPKAGLKPKPATLADYRMLQKRLGLTRDVIVQPSTYGTDNRILIASMKQIGKTARGVAVVNTGVSDAELKELNAAGTRGIRFNLAQGGGTTWEMIEPLAQRILPMGWHVQIQAEGKDILANMDVLNKQPCQVVFDHLAHIPEPEGVKAPLFAKVVEMLQKKKAWVKLSGFYYESLVGPPDYPDSVEVAKGYAKAAPDRCVWGSDWSHPLNKEDAKPNDAHLLDLMSKVADKPTLKRILVDNPAKLYGF
jgi:predicted TIM-barrel fold metal-dependent hydrolase